MGKPKWNDDLRQKFRDKLRSKEIGYYNKPGQVYDKYPSLVRHMAKDTFNRTFKSIVKTELARAGEGGKLFILYLEKSTILFLTILYL